ncbi:MAG: ECF-type sigma factor [Planctomycetota bacterium]|jgi:RNA polymerase sigma factor (TIGR02999 family)
MPDAPAENVTQLLDAVRAGRQSAVAGLMDLVYGELRAIARRQMVQVPPRDTLQATALVHETYLRLFAGDNPGWQDRAHFFFAAARAMRDILIEEARKDASLKRGGGRRRITLGETIASAEPVDEDLLALNDALQRLEASDRTSANVVMLRYFAGLTIEETAQAMAISSASVKRYWQYARAWLRSQILGGAGADDRGTDGGR